MQFILPIKEMKLDLHEKKRRKKKVAVSWLSKFYHKIKEKLNINETEYEYIQNS